MHGLKSSHIAKNWARPSSKHRAKNKLHTIHIRTQCAPTSRMSTSYLSGEIASKMLLRTAGENITQHTISCLSRKNTNKGNHFDIRPDDEYVDNIFHQMMVKKWNLATTTGATIGKTNIEDEQLLNQRERQLFRLGTHQARHQLRKKN